MSQTYLGIDVGKHKLHLALLLPNGKSKPKVIPNTPQACGARASRSTGRTGGQVSIWRQINL